MLSGESRESQMKSPLIFPGPDGESDLRIFERAELAVLWVDPAGVAAGEYGDHGWDADAKPVAFVLEPLAEQPGIFARLLLRKPTVEVKVRALAGPPEPDQLRAALLGRLEQLKPERVAEAAGLSLDALLALVRGVVADFYEEVRARPTPK